MEKLEVFLSGWFLGFFLKDFWLFCLDEFGVLVKGFFFFLVVSLRLNGICERVCFFSLFLELLDFDNFFIVWYDGLGIVELLLLKLYLMTVFGVILVL